MTASEMDIQVLKDALRRTREENALLVNEIVNLKKEIEESSQHKCSCKEEQWQKEFQEIMEKRNEDNVNYPAHYGGAIEVIDFIRDKLTPEELSGYYKGNILKYIARFGKKQTANPIEDIQKAQVYLGWLVDHEGGRNQWQGQW